MQNNTKNDDRVFIKTFLVQLHTCLTHVKKKIQFSEIYITSSYDKAFYIANGVEFISVWSKLFKMKIMLIFNKLVHGHIT